MSKRELCVLTSIHQDSFITHNLLCKRVVVQVVLLYVASVLLLSQYCLY